MPTYTFTVNVPQETQQINDSQPELLENNYAIQELLNVNHVDFNITNSGKHKWVTMPEQGSAPATLASESALYTATSLTSNLDLFYRGESNATPIPITAASNADIGWSYLPSGLIMKWGTISIPGSGGVTYLFPTGSNIPVFTNCRSVQLTPGGTFLSATYIVKLFSFSATQIQVQAADINDQPAAGTAYYLAIGF